MIAEGSTSSAPVRLLDQNQVDGDRGCYFVKLEPTSERFRRHRVFKDAFGARIAIRGTL